MSEVIPILSARGRKPGSLNRRTRSREGEAYRIVQRGGRTLHVYSTVEDPNVLAFPPRGPQTDGTPAA